MRKRIGSRRIICLAALHQRGRRKEVEGEGTEEVEDI